MKELEKTTKEKAVLNPVDKLQEAAELIKADQQRREAEAIEEYQQFLGYLKEKYNVSLFISQPQVIIQSL